MKISQGIRSRSFYLAVSLILFGGMAGVTPASADNHKPHGNGHHDNGNHYGQAKKEAWHDQNWNKHDRNYGYYQGHNGYWEKQNGLQVFINLF